MAKETGQPVIQIAQQSFAVTLLTLWHLQQWERVAYVQREADHFYEASLMSYAMLGPKTLDDMRERFIARHRRVTPEVQKKRDERLRSLLTLHQSLTPTEPH